MHAAGLRAFEARDPKRSGIYAYEGLQRKEFEKLSPVYEKKLRTNAKAWAFFQSQAPYYQRTISRWVMSAKKEETQLTRLARLINDSAHGRRVGILERPSKGSAKGR